MGVVFNIQNSQLWTLSSLTEEIFLGTQPKSAGIKSSSCRFLFSAARNPIAKATEYVTFGFSFRILVFFPFYKCLNVTVCKRQEFFSVLAVL